jgi:hypothetical protein
MMTKLEAMVGYLAGRDGDPTLLKELADPSSEASRFLEATRTRSRALLDQPVVSDRSVEPEGLRSKPRNWFERLIWASLAISALGVTLWVGEARVRRLEANLERANAEDRARSEKLENALIRLANSTASTVDSTIQIKSEIGQIVAKLDQLERQVQAHANRPEPTPKIDPIIAEMRDQLAALHRELSSGEKTRTRHLEDLQSTINDVARRLRLLGKGSQPPEPAIEPPPRRNP